MSAASATHRAGTEPKPAAPPFRPYSRGSDSRAIVLTDLALQLHLTESLDEAFRELGRGLRRLGMWYALFSGVPSGSELHCRGQSFPKSIRFPAAPPLGSRNLGALLRGAPRLIPSAAGRALIRVAPGARLGQRLAEALRSGEWAILPLSPSAPAAGALLVLGAENHAGDLPALSMLARQLHAVLSRLDALKRIGSGPAQNGDLTSGHERTARQGLRLAAVSRSGAVLNAGLAGGGLVALIAECAGSLLDGERCVVSLRDEEADALVPMYSWTAEGASSGLATRGGHSPSRPMDRSGSSKPIQKSDVLLGLTKHRPAGSTASAPLLSQKRVVGQVDVLCARPGAFSDEDLQLLEAFSSQAGAILENSRLLQRMAEGSHDWEETFDAISDGICVRDQSCRIVRANRALADMVGRSVTEITGARLCDEFPELPSACNVCHAPLGWDDAHARLLGQPVELRVNGIQPTLLTVTDFPARVADSGIVRWVTIVKDVTSDRQLQAALVRSEKMRAIGEMASGVAHDFNNLLATILSRSEIALAAELPPPVRRSFEIVRSAAMDGVATVRRIQEYSRVRQDLAQHSADLAEALRGAIELSRHKWMSESTRRQAPVDLVVDIEPTAPVRGNLSELREVFTNLIFNAVDAMPSGGKLTLRSRSAHGRAIVEVADTGTGMKPEVRARIFDPFFTTKGEGGSGLGLAIAYGIVTRSGGQIEVTSTEGEGTTFAVTLPLVPQLFAPPGADREDRTQPIPVARILLIDDDAEVRAGIAGLLRQDGHRVAAYGRAREALDNYDRNAFDCVITDLVMPDLDGWGFARRLRSMDPEVPLIVLTGWHAELTDDQLGEHGVSAVLSKPASRDELRRALASLGLDAPKGGTGAAPSDDLHVLVIDDQPEFAETLADRLRLEGCEVVIAGTGGQGIAEAARRQFDLAIVDLRLPDLDGRNVAAQIRSVEAPPHVVLATGLAVEVGDVTLKALADDVLPKPWQADELQAMLERVRRHVRERMPGHP